MQVQTGAVSVGPYEGDEIWPTMLLRSEMTINCAFFVRSLMYEATIDTYYGQYILPTEAEVQLTLRKSNAASISSMTYSGVGL